MIGRVTKLRWKVGLTPGRAIEAEELMCVPKDHTAIRIVPCGVLLSQSLEVILKRDQGRGRIAELET